MRSWVRTWDMIYSRWSDGIWQKSLDDTSNGTKIVDTSAITVIVSPDKTYLVYVGWNGHLYKYVLATWVATEITSQVSYSPSFSYDWAYILYNTLWWTPRMYRRDTSIATIDNWIPLTWNAAQRCAYSHAGTAIIYALPWSSNMYKKTTVTTQADGSALWSINYCYSMSYTDDDAYIVYVTYDWDKIMKKNAGDTSAGSVISTTSVSAWWCLALKWDYAYYSHRSAGWAVDGIYKIKLDGSETVWTQLSSQAWDFGIQCFL